MADSQLLTELPGVFRLRLPRFDDDRGAFLRALDAALPDPALTPFQVGEIFFSRSHRGVVRGMHFQTPPAAQKKLVLCLGGQVLDVLLDLRRDSPAYGKSIGILLDGFEPTAVLVPHGVAHGFASLADDSVVAYAIDGRYSPDHDAGVRWDSFGFDWPMVRPVVSLKDERLPALATFASPF